MRSAIAFALAAALLTTPIVTGSAFSAGDGGGGGGGGNGGGGGGRSGGNSNSSSGKSSDRTVTECRSGKVWDTRRKRCVEPKQGMLDDDTLYTAGAHLAMAGRYDEAIEVLGYIDDKEQARVLNYLGYSHRKSGRISVGLGYYQEALRIDPDYVLAREYLGEAYLQLGNVTAAKGQLDEIANRRGKDSREYVLLADEILKAGG